jgi:hypothetical protein
MRKPIAGDMVHFVDETASDYNEHTHLPALIQYVYQTGCEGYVHLHIFEADPKDSHAVDSHYSANNDPGTWHWVE